VNVVSIDASSPVPPFEQLRAQLSAQIRSGAITAGAQLPTVRQLAGDLGLAKNTVVRAYRALESEGLVRAGGRAGTTVLDLAAGVEQDHLARVADATRRYLVELERLGVTGQDALDALRRGVAST
jgi:GntR family transcriptional regulator